MDAPRAVSKVASPMMLNVYKNKGALGVAYTPPPTAPPPASRMILKCNKRAKTPDHNRKFYYRVEFRAPQHVQQAERAHDLFNHYFMRDSFVSVIGLSNLPCWN